MHATRLLLAACAIAAACKADGDSAGEHTGATMRAAPLAVAPCGVDATTPLTGVGIGDLRVGAAVAEVRERCGVLADSMRPGPEGSRQRVLVVDLGRDTVDAVVVEDRVFRLHLDSPALRTRDSLGVGSTHRELMARPGSTLAHGEGKAFVITRDPCGLSFRLEGSGSAVESLGNDPRDALRTDEVLVVGCNTTNSPRNEEP